MYLRNISWVLQTKKNPYPKNEVTESEFNIQKAEEDYSYQIGIKEGEALKKGKKKVYLAAKVKGSAMIGSEIYYIPLTISLTEQKPKVTYEQNAIQTFYKDSTGNLTVMSEDAQVKSVSFIPNTKAGKAGLEAIAVDGVANQLMIIPNDCLKNEYTEKFNNKGNLLISFEGYKENANILVKNFKLAADKTKPVISKDYDTVKIYTDISTKAKLTMYSNGEVIMPSNGYTVSWKDEKTKSKDAFSYEQSESDGTIEITSISAKSGTLDLKIASDAWNDVILSSTKINVEKAPKVKVSTNKVVLNQAVGTQMLQPITVSVDGNSNIDITDIKLLPIKEADTEMLDNISQTFDETTTSIMLALKEGVLLEKDYKDNYKLVATLERNQRQVEVSSNIQLQIAIEEPVVTVKSSKFIDSVKRENTYVLCTPKFENIAGAIKAVSLEGTYKNHFVATYVDAPNNKGQVIIKAKSSSGGKNYVLRAGDVYKFKLNFTLDNGQCLKSNEFKVPVKQSKLAVKSDVKNMNLYGSLEGKAYGKVIQFAVSNIKTEEINAIELSSFQDVFAFDYMGNGKGLLYIKDVDKFSGQKSYNLKFNVNTVNTLIGGNVAAVTVKIKNKPVKLSAYDSQKKIFGLYTDNLVYDDDTGVYCIVEKIDKLAGKVNRGYEVSDASYVITDDRNHELISGEFDATGEWEITKLAFLFGGNILILSGTLPDGSIVKEEYTIYNMTNENIGELDTKDDDADGLVNYLEIYYDCDKNDADTDNDGLNDYTECVEINTNPCLVDTDDNGITDFDEDADGDGISNGKEVDLGTKPHDVDSDADTLADGDELNKYGTSPVKADTDGDRVDDNVEVEIGTNPLTADTAFDVTEEVEGNPNVGAVPGVEVLDLKADQVETLEIAPVTAIDNPLLSSTIPGFMGSAYNFEVDGTFENATITFAYSDALLEDDKSAVPTIYYYNEETQALEEVPGQTISNHQVSVPVTHFSTYILLNKTEYQTVWENDVRKPSEDGSGVASIDIAFVIDDSGSMSGNDNANLRISLTQGFLDELRDVDRAAAIRFTSASTILSSFTTDKEAVKESLIANSSGGTDIKSGINSALNEFDKIKTEDDSRISKIMFVLTDGDDGYSNSAYDEYIDIAIENSIKIYTVGLGSPNEDKLKYIAEASGGKYYYATSVSDLEECYEDIEEEVVADVTDSNGDGISDYYTQKICDGDLTTATGYNPFAGMSYETIQKNADYDGDGLKNGEEIEVCATIYGAYIRMNSDPLRKYSDFDTYNDYEEKQQGTDPMNANVFIKKSNVDYLTNDTNFVADNYRIQYNDNFLTQAGVWIGNGIGINSKTETARDMLLSYMSDLNEGEGAYCEDEMWLISAYSWLTGARDNVSKGVDISKFKTSDAPATKTLLENSVTGINNAMDKLVELSGREGTNAKASQIMQGAATHYNNLVSHLPDLDKTVKVIDKAGDILGIVGYVVTAADIINGAFAYHADVAAHMEMLQENIYILDYIIGESQNSFVVAGAKELRGSLESDRDLVLHTLKTFAISAGTTIAVEAVKAAIGSVVPYGTAAMIILDLTDAIFQISDMSERFVQVYTIAEAAHILAAHVKADIASQRTISCNFGQIYVISPNNKVLSKNRIHNLASARYLEELTMKETDDEIKWWTAWIYREKWYDGDKIDSNLVRTKALRQS